MASHNIFNEVFKNWLICTSMWKIKNREIGELKIVIGIPSQKGDRRLEAGVQGTVL